MIVSTQNAQLKRMRLARRCKGEDALIEGPHLLADALAAGLDVTAILATPAFLERADARTLLERLPRPPLTVEAGLLNQLADADSPRGIAAVVYLPRSDITALPARSDGLYVFLDGVQDPGNLGALVRTAEAAGAAGLFLGTGCAHPNHPRALRASAGSLLRLPVVRHATLDAVDTHLAKNDATWLALVPRGGTSIYDAQPSGCLILALGAEGAGLSSQVVAHADRHLHIPLASQVESLNVTVAAAVTLFELRRQSR